MIYLIDFEKTLITDDKKINPLSINLLNNLALQSIVSIVSYEKYDFLKDFVIANNLICDFISLDSCKGKINKTSFENKINKSIIENILFEFNDYIYTAYSSEGFIYNYQERLIPLYPKEYTKSYIDVNSLFISIYLEAFDTLLESLKDNILSYEVIAKDHKKALIKITKSLTNKASVYDIYKKLFPNEKFVGISDSLADIEMLNKCDYSIAMLNGDEKLKRLTNAITEFDNNHDGAMLALNNITKL